MDNPVNKTSSDDDKKLSNELIKKFSSIMININKCGSCHKEKNNITAIADYSDNGGDYYICHDCLYEQHIN